MYDDTCSIEGCNGPHLSRGWCSKHWQRWRRHGDPLAITQRVRGAHMEALQAAAQATTDQCIIVAGGWKRRPYVNRPGRKSIPAARMVWILAEGDPGDAHVLHTCHRGDEGCVNRRHLYLGNHARNMRDMAESGRVSRGARHTHAKLTEDQVREIRRRHIKGRGPQFRGNGEALAEEFGITRSALNAISRGALWHWLM